MLDRITNYLIEIGIPTELSTGDALNMLIESHRKLRNNNPVIIMQKHEINTKQVKLSMFYDLLNNHISKEELIRILRDEPFVNDDMKKILFDVLDTKIPDKEG